VRRALLSLLLVALAARVHAGQAQTPVKVTEAELQRIERAPSAKFPWKTAAPAPTKKAGGDEAVMDLNSSDIIIKALGDFSREEKQGKEVLTLTQDVEIEQIPTQSVLRGQKIRVIRDVKSGQTELLEASGGVEVVTAERRGRGELLTYETRFGPEGQVTKDMYTIEGDPRKGTRAVLWQGEDVIEAERFVNDRRLDTFRVIGGPVAILTIPGTPEAAPPAEVVGGQKGGGLLPTVSLSAGGKIRMKADGEMFYEGASGRVRITRNVVMQQDAPTGGPAMQLASDETTISLLLPPPGQPASASVFSGTLKALECNGRVEMKTATSTILCDRVTIDVQKKVLHMEMKNAKDEVRVYMRDKNMVMIAPKRLTVNLDTRETEAAGPQRIESFTGTPPSNRAAAPAPKK